MGSEADVPRMTRTATPPRRRRSVLQQLRRLLLRAVALAVLGSAALVLPFRIVNPPVTPLMLVRWLQGDGLRAPWVDLDQIAPSLRRAVVASEDARFVDHHGIDVVEMRRAWAEHQRHPHARVRGASTITMQCARNVYLWPPSRTYLRKVAEIWLGTFMELLWGKARILEVYLNVAEWGRGVYGAEAASQQYFGVPAAALTGEQAALLAASLPSPRTRNPGKPSANLKARGARIAARAARVSLGALGR